MFAQNNCIEPGCPKSALSTFNNDKEITEMPGYCLEHSKNPEKTKQEIFDYINSHEKIVGLNAGGIVFENIDLTNKKFYGCNFMHCHFINIHSTGLRSRMSMFDFAIFSDCNLLQSNMQFTSFAGSTFSHTLFTGSDMIQNNFSGIQSYQSSFDDSDLYNSRFVRAKLIDTSFRNCNVKKTVFHVIEQQNVLFKYSNTREAIFDDDQSELFIGELSNKIGYVLEPQD
ncbi:MAG: pentapeptide repeat-containing protein [Treponema sp.]|uniref:pentapeptide repeat-containing protein n=1 Tax=Treponema sp. TaxID=166 RepID=UPI001B604CD1|nr:pentapeptide repeat-containing protein [Treponema sp.]MBP5402289.1 pentapeptide repeat-containing protein [Treponema sp.]MBR5933213.1 pentapeptide repeat-containing protein [Treponema sp.]